MDGSTIETKRCTKCGEVKPLECFSKRVASADGLNAQCKECRNTYDRERYEANPEQAAERNKAWRKSNPDRVVAYNRAYREANRDKVKACNRARYESNFDKVRVRGKEWRDANPGRVKERDRNRYESNPERAIRRAREREQDIEQRTLPWLTSGHFAAMNSVYKQARSLSKSTGVLHHVDHIVPLKARTRVGQHIIEASGLHVPWNLQVLTQPENDSKGSTFDHGWGDFL